MASNSSDSEGEITAEWSRDFQKNRERDKLIRRILRQCGSDNGERKPLHVAIIGTHGVGKSAFVNTIAAALGGDRWREFAYSGSHGTGGGGITVFTTSFPKCCQIQRYKADLLPTLVDIAGFDDHEDVGYTELLRIVFYGRLPVGESLKEAEQYYRKKGLEGLRMRYSRNNEALKIDRVIVLSSATTPVPLNLIKCVLEAAQPSGQTGTPKRAIPIYGVMLKHDLVVSDVEYDKRLGDASASAAQEMLVDEATYQKRKTSFISALGLVGSNHRFLECSNYCNDVDKEERRVETVIPDLDLPVLQFFVQVTEDAMEVMNKDETYDDTLRLNKNSPEPEVQPDSTAHERKEPIPEKRRTPERVPRRKREPNQNNPIDNFGENFVSIMMISFEALLVAFIMYFVLKPPFDMGKIKGICRAQAGKPDDQLAEICRDITESGSAYQYTFLIALAALIAVRVVFAMVIVRLYKRQR